MTTTAPATSDGAATRTARDGLRAVLAKATSTPYVVIRNDAGGRWLVVTPDPDDPISHVVVADTGTGERGRCNAVALASAMASAIPLLDENDRLRREIHRASSAGAELLDAARAVCDALFGPASKDVPCHYDGISDEDVVLIRRLRLAAGLGDEA